MTFQEIGLAIELLIGHNLTIKEVADGFDTTQKELSEVLDSVMVFKNINDKRNNTKVVLQSKVNLALLDAA